MDSPRAEQRAVVDPHQQTPRADLRAIGRFVRVPRRGEQSQESGGRRLWLLSGEARKVTGPARPLSARWWHTNHTSEEQVWSVSFVVGDTPTLRGLRAGFPPARE